MGPASKDSELSKGALRPKRAAILGSEPLISSFCDLNFVIWGFTMLTQTGLTKYTCNFEEVKHVFLKYAYTFLSQPTLSQILNPPSRLLRALCVQASSGPEGCLTSVEGTVCTLELKTRLIVLLKLNLKCIVSS